MYFNAMDLETGEVLQSKSGLPWPRWTQDPLLRALKLAEWKKENKV